MKEKINDYEMSIRKTTKESAKCSACGYGSWLLYKYDAASSGNSP